MKQHSILHGAYRAALYLGFAVALAACSSSGGPTVEEVTARAWDLGYRSPEVSDLACTRFTESGAYECNFIMNGTLALTWRLIKIGDKWTAYNGG